MHVLASLRASQLSMADQGRMRDLILSYTNGGKDPSLKNQIQRELQALHVAPSEVETRLEVGQVHSFGSSRSTPTFRPPVPETPPTAEPVSPHPVTEPIPVQVKPLAAPASAPLNTLQTPPQPATAHPSAQTNTPGSDLDTEPATSADAVTATNSTVPANDSGETPLVHTPAAPTATLDRIRAIKSEINQLVGNPVHLVETNNEIGREYMAAMLNAMKSISAGGTEEAMERLETAFAAAKSTIAKQPAETPQAPQADVLQPTPTPPEVIQNQAAPHPSSVANPPQPAQTNQTPSVPRAETPAQAVPIVTTAPVPTAARQVQPRPEPEVVPASSSDVTSVSAAPGRPDSSAPIVLDQTDTGDSASRWKDVPMQFQTNTTTTPPQPPTSEPARSTPAVPASSNLGAQPPVPPPPASATPPSKLKPLAEAGEPLHTPTELPTATEMAQKHPGDPLYTQAVTDGLQQLLLDWQLFNKSGLFGTGPKGLEHPLFLKTKDMLIPILLAGRFDGASQEIKQSVTDYMNGWRYEQGIVYEQGETFEHYLRRVIKHILDLHA